MKQLLFWVIAIFIVGGIPAILKIALRRINDKIADFVDNNEWIYVIWWILSISVVWFIIMPLFNYEFSHYNF